MRGGVRALSCYTVPMSPNAKEIFRLVESWPEEDQEELAAPAREIEARRTGVYALSADEMAAIDAARRSGLASDDFVAAFWKRYGVA